jgi:thymidylate synthase
MHRHFFTEGATLPEAYHNALRILEKQGPVYPCPDYDTTMKEVGMTFFVEKADAEPFVSRLFCGGHYELQQYKMEILDGILDFKIGDGTCWEYTYHDRFVRQLPFIREELRRNPDTRRAVMNIRNFDVDSRNTHPACLQSMQFMLRDGDLHMMVMMRSNDAVQATFMNAFAFISLQCALARELGCGVGSYTHTAHSFHAYEKSFDVLKKYVEDIESKPFDKLTYEYEGFYRDMMEESVSKIMEQVNKLKENMGK